MSVPEPPVTENLTCRRCGAVGTHSLHCPTLRLSQGWVQRSDEEGTR